MGARLSSQSQEQEAPHDQQAELGGEVEVVHEVEGTPLAVPVVKNGEQPFIEEPDKTYLGEDFEKVKPVMKLVGQDNPQFHHDSLQLAPPLKLRAFNHVAIGCSDVDALRRFYTKVLGFEEIPRPDLGFKGSWLAGLGFMIHIIESDPSVPLRVRNWKDQYSEEPEAWYIRRGNHLALEVEDFDAAERSLRQHGVEYSRHVLPEANVRQLFLYDPEGNGIELGVYDNTRAFLRSKGCNLEL